MNLLPADYIVTCNEGLDIAVDKAVAFDSHIIAIDELEMLIKQYPNATVMAKEEHSVLMPGLINAHTHLEFCTHRCTLPYGNFVNWLYGVITHRDEIIAEATQEAIDGALVSDATKWYYHHRSDKLVWL